MILNKQRFEDAYKQLRDKAYKNGDKEPSFMTGFWYAQEGYKYGIWEDARKDMALISWPDHKDDTKYILQMASQPFGIISRDEKKQQNLVSPQNYGKLLHHVFGGSEKIRKEAADALYSLYYGKDEQEAFERITKLLKGLPDPISVVSFYFFLKDQSGGDFLYVPARKEGTTERLGKLGLQTACLKKCTWEGYQEYLDLIKQIQCFLQPYHPNATLLDAQSFLWMMKLP